MPSLSDKLAGLGVQLGASHILPPPSKRTSPAALIDVIPGAWENTSRGECFVVRKQFPAGHNHGSLHISGIPDMRFFELIDQFKGISRVSPEDFLFIDTETTGLAGGAGTYVFLIGAARFDQGSLNFCQFFLQDPQSESAQLAALESFSAGAKVIVSYNGKSFDLPRIKTRFRYQGWPDPFEDIYHIDLLHIARRLWKDHLPGCTLGDLEHNLLGLQRDGLDIPGWQVSSYFFEYIHTDDPAPLGNIFYHNEVDVISLAALLEYTSDRLSSPLSENFLGEPDLVSFGRYFYSLRLYGRAIEVLAAALENPELPGQLSLTGKLLLAASHKKLGDSDRAVPLWKDCAEEGSFDSFIELAKYAEHISSDYEEAIHWTLSAIDSLPSLSPSRQAGLSHRLDHRLRRLKRKAKR